MSVIPGGVDAERQPPMTVPLRHFLVGLCFLLAGLGQVGGLVPGRPALAHVHLLLVGWVCLTIMGAMTQFVPVWSGVALYSRRLATLQLALVALGLAGFVAALLGNAFAWLLPFGAAMVAGFWVFAYNVGRTLAHVDRLGVTSLAGWALLTLPAWVRSPTSHAHVFGAPGAAHLLALGAIGFVVFDTLYHVVPFVVWVHRYSDLLGFEDVPMIDDCYSDRLAALDGTALVAGTTLLVASELVATPPVIRGIGGALVGIGAVVFAANLLEVVRRHGPHSLSDVLFGALATSEEHGGGPDARAADGAEASPASEEGAE